MGAFTISNFTTVIAASDRASVYPVAPPPFDSGWWGVVGAGGGSDDGNILVALASAVGDGILFLFGSGMATPYSASIEFGFDLNTPIFSLDGGPLISFNQLPSGFQITGLNLSILTDGRTVAADSGSISFGGQTQSMPVNNGSNFQLMNFSFGSISPISLTGYRLLINYSTPDEGIGTSLTDVLELLITGSYDTLSYQWSVDNGSGNFNSGQIVTVRSNNGGLNGIRGMRMSAGDNEYQAHIIEQSADGNLLRFIIPSLGGYSGSSNIIADGNGTQFSGTVIIAPLTILYSDASGIYTLVEGKRSDTVYVAGSSETTEVPIPTPFARTGFLGG